MNPPSELTPPQLAAARAYFMRVWGWDPFSTFPCRPGNAVALGARTYISQAQCAEYSRVQDLEEIERRRDNVLAECNPDPDFPMYRPR